MPQKFKNCLYFTYWGIFLASGTSLLSSLLSSKNLLSLVSFYQPYQNDLSWSLNVGWIIKNLLLQIKFCHLSEPRLWRTGILTKSKGQCLNFHGQWLYKYILCCTFWFQRPCKCKCYFDYHVLSPMILWLNPEEIPIKTIFSCWETGSFLIQKRGLPLLFFLFN